MENFGHSSLRLGYPVDSNIMQTEESNLKLGGTIDSWCGKCKLILAHTIEALVGDKPARVSCNTCKSQHRYNPTVPKSPRPASTGGAPMSRAARAGANRYQSLLKDSSVVMTYSANQKYQPGDVVDHATFGRGAVTATKDGSKIEVLFESGTKTLIHAR